MARRDELIDLLKATERLVPAYDSRFHVYIPNPVAYYFHGSHARTRCAFGGNRSSKTYSMMVDIVAQFMGKAPKSLEGVIPKHRLNPARRIRLCMEDYPNAFVKTIYPYIQQLVPADYIKDVVKEQGRIKAITNSAGGFIEFMVYESDVRKFQGSSRDVCAYDEEPPEVIRNENLARLIDTDGEEIFATTPLETTPTFLYSSLYLNAGTITEKVGDHVVTKTNPAGNPNIHVFFFSIWDNRAISHSAAMEILSQYPEEERLARTTGQFVFRSGLVYPHYSDSIHLIDEFDDWKHNDDYTLYVAIDPHPRTPHAVLFMVARRDGLLFVVDELFIKATAKELVDAIGIKCAGKTPECIIIDPIASTPDPSTGSCFALELALNGLYPPPVPASKDRTTGIIKVNELMRPDEDGKPGLYVTRNCTRFRYEITHYSWDNWSRNARLSKGEKQVPVDRDDHLMECLYRLVLLNPAWVSAEQTLEEV